MYWYENSHFKPNIGEVVLDSLLSNKDCTSAPLDHRELFEKRLEHLKQSQPKLVESIKRLMPDVGNS
jgi:hypothetical protein